MQTLSIRERNKARDQQAKIDNLQIKYAQALSTGNVQKAKEIRNRIKYHTRQLNYAKFRMVKHTEM